MPVIDFNGVALSYAETGVGDTVVLLHSSASSSRQWRLLTESLADRFHVVAPDLYGYGRTGAWPRHAGLTLSDEAALVRAAVEASTRRPAPSLHLVGHSYGGAVALRFAQENPGRVRSLTLIEPVAFHLLRGAEADRVLLDEVADLAQAAADAVAADAPDRAMARFVDYWNGAGAWSRLEPDTRAELGLRARKVALDFAAIEAEQTRLDAYRAVTAPALVLIGTESPRPTRRIAAMLAATLPSARHQAIAGAGHMAPLTHAPRTNALIEAFMRNAVSKETQFAPASAAAAGGI